MASSLALAPAVGTLASAVEARATAFLLQFGSGPLADIRTIATDPRPEVIEAQNRIWLSSWTRAAFRIIGREEPTLTRDCTRIVAAMDGITRRIPRVDHGADLAFYGLPDTTAEARGDQ